MTITPPEQSLKKVKVTFSNNPVETSFEKWAKPGHFSRLLSKGPNTTTWVCCELSYSVFLYFGGTKSCCFRV